MKPRVFVSSTYYDLKYVRESLERFIKNYDFEPILFESGNVLFEPSKKIDVSCYSEVGVCHMMVLIIGGRYGSLASGDEAQEKQKEYDKTVVSITQKEYETALTNGIPTFVFIDKNVYGEYQTYSKNRSPIDNGTLPIEFAFVDSRNVFKFIDKVSNTPIKTFERIEEIEQYLKQQISAMFYQYLDGLRNATKDSKVLDAVSEIKSVSERMNVMVQELGKQLLSQDDSQGYKKVIDEQNKILIDFYRGILIEGISINNSTKYNFAETSESEFQKYAKLFYDNYLKNPVWADYPKEYKRYAIIRDELTTKLLQQFRSYDEGILGLNVSYDILTKFKSVIEPAIGNNKELEELFLTKLTNVMYLAIAGLPF
jgi:hypothetical protein